MEKVKAKQEEVLKVSALLNNAVIEADDINEILADLNSAPLLQRQKASQLLLRPNVGINNLMEANSLLNNELEKYSQEALEQVEIQFKYDIYIQKEKELVDKMSTLEEQVIPQSFNYNKISSLSNEARQKFNKIRPETLGQASRISGVNPSDVQILMVYMGR
jgi:tRNA uridine 5-carboxymethylaminomethyl modification enzyme